MKASIASLGLFLIMEQPPVRCNSLINSSDDSLYLTDLMMLTDDHPKNKEQATGRLNEVLLLALFIYTYKFK